MRILHIEDAAAVACILAKYQNLTQGHKSKVVKLDKYDKFGFYKFYKELRNYHYIRRNYFLIPFLKKQKKLILFMYIAKWNWFHIFVINMENQKK